MSANSDVLVASGHNGEKVCLSTLQSKMNSDPEGFMSELITLYSHFCSSLHRFHQQSAALKLSSIAAKELGETATFLAHVTPLYPTHLSDFPLKLIELLRCSARSLFPSFLRCHLAQALILLIKRKFVEIGDTLALFMELQFLGDKNLRKLAFEHVVGSIRRMNRKRKNKAKNRTLQNILFSMLQEDDESKAKRSLIVLCDLHRRRVWLDDRTANAICTSCFHSSSRIMIVALSFLLLYDLPDEVEDTDASRSEDEMTLQKADVVLNRESVYQAIHKGTIASKKKKKRAKLQRAIQSLKRQQHATSEKSTPNQYSPLNQLKDAQDFAEKLFSRLQDFNEQFEVKMMMLKVIARTVGLHRLILLKFYPFLQTYVKPHQCDITEILATAVQACHNMVPPDAVEPLFRQVVNQFVHDRCCTEAIAVGLNVVRELCLRIPLLITEDLLQELVLYKKSHEKAISTGARSLITLFRELCPSLLVKKYCGRPINPKARPKAVGEVNVSSNINMSDLDLFDNADEDNNDDNESTFSMIGNEGKNDGDNKFELSEKENVAEDDDVNDGDHIDDKNEEESDGMVYDDDDVDKCDEHADEEKIAISKKRKVIGYNGQLNAADTGLRAVKRLTESKKQYESPDFADGILSNEDFRRVKELKAKKEAKPALAQHGLLRKGSEAKSTKLKIPSSDQLTATKVDPAQLEINIRRIRRKMSKNDRLALVRLGREDRGWYVPCPAIKSSKLVGVSYQEKDPKITLALAAKRAKVPTKEKDTESKVRQTVGEVNVSSDMSDLDLLDSEDEDNNDDNEYTLSIIGNEGKNDGDKQFELSEKENVAEDDDVNDGDHIDDKNEEESDGMVYDDDDVDKCDEHADEEKELKIAKSKKRKVIDYNGQLNAADTGLRSVKRLTESEKQYESPDLTDGILSGFIQIIELKAKKEAKPALAQHGLLRKGSEAKSTKLKIPSSDQLTATKVDPAELEINIRRIGRKMSKKDRLTLVRLGREDRGWYVPSRPIKFYKPVGVSYRKKDPKKSMALAAKRAKVARSRQKKKMQKQRSDKQFQGKQEHFVSICD